MTSKSVEQQLTVSTDSSRLVPYEDDVSDDSEAEKETAEKTENTCVMTTDANTNVEHCADSYENTCSQTAVVVTNGETDDIVSTNDTEKLCRPAQPSETSENNHVPDCSDRLVLSGDNNCGGNNLSEPLSNSLSVAELESVEKHAASLLPGTTEDSLTALINGDMGCETVQSKPVAVDDGSACHLSPVKSDHPSNDYNAISNSIVASRKRHARDKSKQRRKKHQRHHVSRSSASVVCSSDEEVEYVWVEKTADTMAQQPTGTYHLLSVLLVIVNIHHVPIEVRPKFKPL